VQTQSTGTQSAAVVASPAAVSLTDEEVVVRVRAGDTQMFEILMRRYNQRLYRATRAILRNDVDAEDAVQQAYLNAYRHLAQFEGRARFSTWLTRIAVYEALARRRRSRDKPVGSGDEEHVDNVASTTPDPERQAYVGELGALLEAALAALPDGYRSVFMLREVDGLNTAETAQQLRLSEGHRQDASASREGIATAEVARGHASGSFPLRRRAVRPARGGGHESPYPSIPVSVKTHGPRPRVHVVVGFSLNTDGPSGDRAGGRPQGRCRGVAAGGHRCASGESG
jgi:RNA polymerase sigma-70 factor, ECF subfamily